MSRAIRALNILTDPSRWYFNYPGEVAHSEGQAYFLSFRTAISELRQDYGVKVSTLWHHPEQAQAFYRLDESYESAVAKVLGGKIMPATLKEPRVDPLPVQRPPDAKETLPCKPTTPSDMGKKGGLRSGEVRRAKAKYVRVGSRYVLRSKLTEEQLREAQGNLLLTSEAL